MEDKLICCPEFNPSLWDNKILNWNNKRFIKGDVRTFLYIPIGFGKTMQKLQSISEKSGVIIQDYLCLSEHSSKWKMQVYLSVDKEVENANNVVMSGTFFSKVYEGPFQDTGKWTKDFNDDMIKRGYIVDKQYMWYTTCPKCAKKYGHNSVVIIGEIKK